MTNEQLSVINEPFDLLDELHSTPSTNSGQAGAHGPRQDQKAQGRQVISEHPVRDRKRLSTWCKIYHFFRLIHTYGTSLLVSNDKNGIHPVRNSVSNGVNLVFDVGGNHVFVFRHQLVPGSRQVDFPGNETVLPAACASQQSYPGARSTGHYNHGIVDAGFHRQYGSAPVALGRAKG